MNSTSLAAAGFAIWFGATCAAEPFRMILRAGDPLGPPGHTIASITGVTTNGVGGFGVAVNTFDGTTTLGHILTTVTSGVAPPDPPTLRFSEATVGSLVQTAFEGEFGLSDAGQVAFSATVSRGNQTGLDSLWIDSTPVLVGGDAAALFPGRFWSFFSRVRMTHSGTPYWRGGVSATPGAASVNRALMKGNPPERVIAGGDVLPGLPTSIDLTPASTLFVYRYSPSGTHYLSVELIDGATLDTDAAVVMDGSGLSLGGALVREGSSVPAAIGGRSGEHWATFDALGVTDTGGYLIVGGTDAPSAMDDFVLVNGRMRYRDGDTIDGETVYGDIEDGVMNGSGDFAVLWDTQSNTIETLIVNDRIVLREGQSVDLDRDGTPDPTSRIADMGGAAGLAIGERVGGLLRVYVRADVDTHGTVTTSDDTGTVLEVTVCLADFNRSGEISVQDIFDFLSAYFAGAASADYNNSGSVSVQDIFDYLQGYFLGCG